MINLDNFSILNLEFHAKKKEITHKYFFF